MLLLGLWLGINQAIAAQSALEISAAHNAPIALTKYFALLEDASLTWTLDDVRNGQPSQQFSEDLPDSNSVGLGYSHSAFWLRLRLANPGDQPLVRFLEIANPSLSIVEFHQPGLDGNYVSHRTGGQLPFQTRPYAHRHFVFPIELASHSDQVVYLRVQSERPMSILATLATPTAFARAERSEEHTA